MEIQPDDSPQHVALLIDEADEPSGAPCDEFRPTDRGDADGNGASAETSPRQRRNIVQTVDGDWVPSSAAQELCRKMYYTGFALLPLLWAVNVWLFWPSFRGGANAEITKLTRRSAAGFVLASAIFLPWMLTFMIGQEAVFGSKLFDELDAGKIDLAKWGLVF